MVPQMTTFAWMHKYTAWWGTMSNIATASQILPGTVQGKALPMLPSGILLSLICSLMHNTPSSNCVFYNPRWIKAFINNVAMPAGDQHTPKCKIKCNGGTNLFSLQAMCWMHRNAVVLSISGNQTTQYPLNGRPWPSSHQNRNRLWTQTTNVPVLAAADGTQGIYITMGQWSQWKILSGIRWLPTWEPSTSA